MKRNNKKGFTIVELVIVIAVIAILAGVLIPTFTGIITKANDSAALQQAANTYKESIAYAKNATWDDNTEGTIDAYVISGLYVFKVNNNALDQKFEKMKDADKLTEFKTAKALFETEEAAKAGAAVGDKVYVKLVIEDSTGVIYVPYTVPAATNP